VCTLSVGRDSRCEVDPVTGYPFPIYCPSICVNASESRKVTEKEKVAFLGSEVTRIRQLLKTKIPPELFDAVSAKFPSWVPAIFLKRSDYLLKFERSLAGLRAEFAVEDKAKKRESMIFYANGEDRDAGVPTVAFEGNGGVKFQRFPFLIDDHQRDPMSHICLLMRGGFVTVGAASYDRRNDMLDDLVERKPMGERFFLLDLGNKRTDPKDKLTFGVEQGLAQDESDLNKLMFDPPESIRVSCFESILR